MQQGLGSILTPWGVAWARLGTQAWASHISPRNQHEAGNQRSSFPRAQLAPPTQRSPSTPLVQSAPPLPATLSTSFRPGQLGNCGLPALLGSLIVVHQKILLSVLPFWISKHAFNLLSFFLSFFFVCPG